MQETVNKGQLDKGTWERIIGEASGTDFCVALSSCNILSDILSRFFPVFKEDLQAFIG